MLPFPLIVRSGHRSSRLFIGQPPCPRYARLDSSPIHPVEAGLQSSDFATWSPKTEIQRRRHSPAHTGSGGALLQVGCDVASCFATFSYNLRPQCLSWKPEDITWAARDAAMTKPNGRHPIRALHDEGLVCSWRRAGPAGHQQPGARHAITDRKRLEPQTGKGLALLVARPHRSAAA